MALHHKISNMFKGPINLFTVLSMVVGGYFVAYPLVQISIEHLGKGWTILIGLILMIIGFTISGELHRCRVEIL